MPNGIFPVPRFESRNPRRSAVNGPSLALRLRTLWRRRHLDEQLSRGADPASSAELSLRAAQLVSRTVRSQLADALIATLDKARRPERLRLELQPHRAEIRNSADDLLSLILRLRDGRPIEVRGAARTALLLTPGASPFDADSGDDLREAVRSARLALDEAASAGQRLSAAA